MAELVPALICALAFGVPLTLWARAERSRLGREAAERASRTDLADALAVARGADEAAELVVRHLEPLAAGRKVHVALAGTVTADHVCAALRLGRPHEDGDVLRCDACAPAGEQPGSATCWPLVVRGEPLGSVLVRQPEPPTPHERTVITDTVSAAAPVLGALHIAASAEARAAADRLTGLPSRKVVSDTLRRMAAQAGRQVASLTLIAIDLDHFDELNNDCGRDAGDAVLEAVGSVLQGVIRESDFVGRLGGEEFVVLAPDTDVQGAIVLAENLRRAVSAVDVPSVDRQVTASIGIATVPEHAGSVEELLRAADRALLSAKEGGRDRVVVSPTG